LLRGLPLELAQLQACHDMGGTVIAPESDSSDGRITVKNPEERQPMAVDGSVE
jgi:hypothetical protein